MMNSNYYDVPQTVADSSKNITAQDVEVGLVKHFQKIYALVALALLVAGGTAMAIASSPLAYSVLFSNKIIFFGAMFAPLVLMLTTSFMYNKLSAFGLFFILMAMAVAFGVTDSVLFVMVKSQTGSFDAIYQAFFVTSAAFVGLNFFGIVTRRNLSMVGTICAVGLFGLIAASILQIFVKSGALEFAISLVGVVIFSGLIAARAQTIKVEYPYFLRAGQEGKAAVMHALGLFISFINLFNFILRLFINRD